jgi:hypothetical protein
MSKDLVFTSIWRAAIVAVVAQTQPFGTHPPSSVV